MEIKRHYCKSCGNLVDRLKSENHTRWYQCHSCRKTMPEGATVDSAPKMFSVERTTLGEINNGHTDMTANCLYKGTTVVWAVNWHAKKHYDKIGQTMPHDSIVLDLFYTKTMHEAVKCVDWANENEADWDGVGDFEMIWHKAPACYMDERITKGW